MLNVVTTLQQRCGNVLKTSESDIVTTLIFDRVTTLWQRCQNVAVPAGKYFDFGKSKVWVSEAMA